MGHTLKQLGQIRPSDISATSLYSPPQGESVVHSIVVCNTSGSDSTYRIFVSNTGSTYDETTALFWDIALPANTTDTLEVKICMNNVSGNLAVRSGNNNAITFTAFGEEIT